MHEQYRIRFLVERDGLGPAQAWVERTLRIYRRAVLDKAHFASTAAYRREFIEACCDFRRWLGGAHQRAPGSDSSVPQANIACEICRTQVPISEAKSEEAVDYVLYFCGLDCYEKWCHQKNA